MAVKAKAEITLASVRDIKNTTRYYLLQSSTAAKTAKPTANPPGGSWVKTEPSYTAGSTNSLYFTDLTVFSDNTFAYSDVSLSSSYEAAKAAYNKAVDAQNNIDNLEIGGRNLLLDTDAMSLTKASAQKNRYFSDSSNTTIVPEFFELTDAPINVGNGTRFTAAEATATNAGRDQCWYNGDVVPMVSGQEYTLSVYARVTSGTKMRLRMRYGVSAYPGKNIDVDSTEWKRYSWTFTYSATSAKDTTGAGARIYIGGVSYYEGVLGLCGYQLEKGSKATDWKPAPEDTSQEIAYSADLVRTYAESIMEQKADEIQISISTVTGTLTTDIQDTKDALAQTDAALSGSVNSLQKRVSDQEDALLDYKHETSTYFRFNSNGLNIGKQEDGDESPYSINIDNEKMAFLQNGNEIAYVQYNKMHINAIEAMDRMSVGAAADGGYFDFISTIYGMGVKWRAVSQTTTAAKTAAKLMARPSAYQAVADDEGVFSVDFGGDNT